MPKGYAQCGVFLDDPLPSFEEWNSWYGKYVDSDILLRRGFERDTSWSTEEKPAGSRLYEEHFQNGNVDYLGRGARFCKMSAVEVVNSSLCDYLAKAGKTDSLGEQQITRRGETLRGDYRKAFTNIKAGFRSISKYDKAQPTLDNEAWALAGEWTKKHFQPFMGGSGVLSKEDVLQEMDMTTSAGYPWSRTFHCKAEMLADSRAAQVLDDYWNVLGTVEEKLPIWTCSEKVEVRSVAKLLENKVRTFTASPIEHSVALNRMCLDANCRFYDSANQTWSYVGDTKFFRGWDRLHGRLNRLPHAFELDESDYDASLFARALFGQRDIRWSMYAPEFQTEENWARLTSLYKAIVHAVIILENGEIIRKHTGNPSGSVNTIVDNTMILFRLFSYAWIRICKKIGREFSYQDFMRNVEAALNGDDNTYTVSDEALVFFTPAAIMEIWSGIGVTTKTPCMEPRKVEEVRFLSQGFFFNKRLGIYLPTPETAKVMCSLMYGSSVDDVRWHYLRACALRIDSWGNEELRAILTGYINYLNLTYRDQMVGVCKDIPMSEIRGVWKSDAALEAMYSGLEDDCSEYSQLAHLQNFVYPISFNRTPLHLLYVRTKILENPECDLLALSSIDA